MRFPQGYPSIYETLTLERSLREGGGGGAHSNDPANVVRETVVDALFAPASTNCQHIMAVLTQQSIQFWSCWRDLVKLASVPLPQCSLVAGGDNGCALQWHPLGQAVAVGTLDRRVLLFEADISGNPAEAVVEGKNGLQLADAHSRVCFSMAVKLDYGLILKLSSAPRVLLVSTSGGFVVGVGWNSGQVLFSWSTNHVLQSLSSSSHNSNNNTTTLSSSTARLSSSRRNTNVSPGGSIVFFTHHMGLQLGCFVLSDGSLGFLRTERQMMQGGGRTAAVPPDDRRQQLPPSTSSKPSLLQSIGNLMLFSSPPPAPRHTDSVTPPLLFQQQPDGGGPDGVCHFGLSATGAAVSGTHRVVAVSCTDVVLKFFALKLESFALSPLQRRGDPAGRGESKAAPSSSDGALAWCEDVHRLGSVNAMQWSQDEVTLCVAFRKFGLAVFDHSGVCLFSTFSRHADATPLPAAGGAHPRAAAPPAWSRGCAVVAWDPDGFRLFAVESQSSRLVCLPFVKAATVESASEWSAGAIATYTPDSISFFVNDLGEGATWEGPHRLPEEYVSENFPLRWCSVSSDGMHAAACGSRGAAIYSRRVRRWRLFGDRSQEARYQVCTEPCWVQSLAVVLPIRNISTKKFELLVYPRFHLNDQSLLDRIAVEKRILSVASCTHSCSDALSTVTVLDAGSTVFLYVAEQLVDSVRSPKSVHCTLRLLRSICLWGSKLQSPLAVIPFPLPRESSQSTMRGRRGPAASLQRLPLIGILRRDHRLDALDLRSAPPSPASAAAPGDPSARLAPTTQSQLRPYLRRLTPSKERVYDIWFDLNSHRLLLNETVAVLFTSSGLSVAGVRYPSSSSQSSSVAAPSSSSSRNNSLLSWGSLVTGFDPESFPLGILPLDGLIVMGTEGIQRDGLPGLLPHHVQLQVNPALYTHHFLFPLFVVNEGIHSSTNSELPLMSMSQSEAPSSSDDLLVEWDSDLDEEGGAAASLSEYWWSLELPRAATDGNTTHYMDAVLQRLRESGSFVGTMDYLLHLVMHDERGASKPRSSSVTACYDRRRVLHAVITVLKRYPEYHTVMVGFVRKIDVTKWRMVFAVIGSPLEFFEDCVVSGRLLEAAYVVRVIMMDMAGAPTPSSGGGSPASTNAAGVDTSSLSRHAVTITAPAATSSSTSSSTAGGGGGGDPHLDISLVTASQCAHRLLHLVLRRVDFVLAAELLRFTALLFVELHTSSPFLPVPTSSSSTTTTTTTTSGSSSSAVASDGPSSLSAAAPVPLSSGSPGRADPQQQQQQSVVSWKSWFKNRVGGSGATSSAPSLSSSSIHSTATIHGYSSSSSPLYWAKMKEMVESRAFSIAAAFDNAPHTGTTTTAEVQLLLQDSAHAALCNELSDICFVPFVKGQFAELHHVLSAFQLNPRGVARHLCSRMVRFEPDPKEGGGGQSRPTQPLAMRLPSCAAHLSLQIVQSLTTGGGAQKVAGGWAGVPPSDRKRRYEEELLRAFYETLSHEIDEASQAWAHDHNNEADQTTGLPPLPAPWKAVVVYRDAIASLL